MSICTFFGHKDTPKETAANLQEALIDLIENKNVDSFYVGNNGGFDILALSLLKILKKTYTHIKYSVVLAYLPKNDHPYDSEDHSHSIYPEGIETSPPRFAIDKRNRWMIEKSDYVITYVCRNFGGAAKYKELALKKGKTVINLAKQTI